MRERGDRFSDTVRVGPGRDGVCPEGNGARSVGELVERVSGNLDRYGKCPLPLKR
jgi:hypothetical protein